MELELDWESAFCSEYIESWFSLQNRRLEDKSKKNNNCSYSSVS